MSFFKATIDTGSPAFFVHKRTADVLLISGKNIKFLPSKDLPGDTLYVDFNRKPKTLHGTLLTNISSLGWKVENAKFVVTENRRRCLLGLDLQSSFGIRTVQERYQTIMKVSEATLSEDSQTWKKYFTSKYSDVFSRLGRSKNHRVHSVFKDPLVTIQEKGRRVPIHIQQKVGAELTKLMKEGHIVKLNKCANRQKSISDDKPTRTTRRGSPNYQFKIIQARSGSTR